MSNKILSCHTESAPRFCEIIGYEDMIEMCRPIVLTSKYAAAVSIIGSPNNMMRQTGQLSVI